jgi:hypothetical protein
MTYNFDADRWYDNELALLERRLGNGEMTRGEFDAAVDELVRRYNEMIDRLDGTYRLPDANGGYGDNSGR